ncbi:hypothetical protein D3C77_417640 [compost metagenome]
MCEAVGGARDPAALLEKGVSAFEGELQRLGHHFVFFNIQSTHGKHNDKENKQQCDQIGIGDQPAILRLRAFSPALPASLPHKSFSKKEVGEEDEGEEEEEADDGADDEVEAGNSE